MISKRLLNPKLSNETNLINQTNIQDMKTCFTWEAKIFMGMRVGYSKEINSIYKVKKLIQVFVDEYKLGVTLTQTEFIYVSGNEPGVIIGIINYPRFPDTIGHLTYVSLELANKLMADLKQIRCTVCFPDRSVLLENPDAPKE